jgi:hypothetical protein
MRQPRQLEMPIEVFVNAVHLAKNPCPQGAESHPAIKCVTDWWNATAKRRYLYAYAFSLSVRYEEDWKSGDPEEGWILKDTWERYARPHAQATLLDNKVCLVFYKAAVDKDHSFEARAVDGSDGTSCGKWEGVTGNGILTRYSHQDLSIFPVRFPEVWDELCRIDMHRVDEANHDASQCSRPNSLTSCRLKKAPR